VRASSKFAFKKFLGARILRSESLTISSARRRARSERPPQAFAWIRQAMRRTKNCLWFDRLGSLKTSRYRSLSCPAVMWPKASISSRTEVVLLVSVLIVLTSSPMCALFLGRVKSLRRRVRESESQIRCGKDGGDLLDRLGMIGIASVHERSPWRPPTTLSAWRSMRRLVGLSTRFVSASVNYIRRNFEKCRAQASDFAEQLTNSENASRDAEKAAK
jgi:hypothetical protein